MRARPSSPRAEGGRVVALMGSYRKGGTIDATIAEILEGARERGAVTRKLELVDHDIGFCRNCRTCCQPPGPERGPCVLHDDLDGLLKTLEEADALVLGAPVNFGDVNALTRQFQERMLGLSWWPWGRLVPRLRSAHRTKPAVLVTSSSAPSPLTRAFARPLRTLREMARLLGARPVRTLVVGRAGGPVPRPDAPTRRRARALGRELGGLVAAPRTDTARASTTACARG